MAQAAAGGADPHAAARAFANRHGGARGQALGRANDMEPPVTQTGESAVIHAHPDAAIAALIPCAHAVARQVILHGEPLIPSIGRNVKQAVAVMIKPHAAGAVFVHAHGPARGGAKQAAPLRDFRGPGAAFHFAQPVIVQHPQRAGFQREQFARLDVRRAIGRRHGFKRRAVPKGNFVFRTGPNPAPRIGHERVDVAAGESAVIHERFKFTVGKLQNVPVVRQKPEAVFGVRALKGRGAGRRKNFPRGAGIGGVALENLAVLRDKRDRVGGGHDERGVQVKSGLVGQFVGEHAGTIRGEPATKGVDP